MVVKKNDSIVVPSSIFDDENETHLEWRQNLMGRKADFHCGTYTVEGKGDTGVIFIAASLKDQFTSAASLADGQYRVTVSDDFTFGQKNSSGAGRFLVYKREDDKPYQHRFVKSALHTYGDRAVQLTKQFGYEATGMLQSQAEAIFGDYLRPWSEDVAP